MAISLSKKFIEKYVHMAPPIYVVIYIYGLQYDRVERERMVLDLRVTQGELEEAISFWIHQGILEKKDGKLIYILEDKALQLESVSDETDSFGQKAIYTDISTFEKKESIIQHIAPLAPIFPGNKMGSHLSTPTETNETIGGKDPLSTLVLQRVETKPTYSPVEIGRFMEESFDIQILFGTAERLFGKAISTTEMNTLLTFYEYYRLPVEVIEEMLAYCVNNGHKSWWYIEKVAHDWAESGINTIDKAAKRMATFNKAYRSLLKSLGRFNQYPGEKEIKYLDSWLDTQLPMDILIEACERCTFKTKEGSFEYADAIIKNWTKAQVKTMEDVQKLDQLFEEKKLKNQGDQANAYIKNHDKLPKTVANFTQRNWDFKEIEALDLQETKDRLVN